MTRILLVKTSSLGDVVHNLPVVGDIRRHLPEAQIDWVVEETFTDIARMHPDMSEVIPVALRRWRREGLRATVAKQLRHFLGELRRREYHAVIDTQGLLKSAVVTCAARGPRFGLDWKSSREPLRAFYDRTFRVPWGQHAVERNRSLAAQALGYRLDTTAVFGIHAPQRRQTWLPHPRYAVLLHATSAAAKLWSESAWVKLHKYLIFNDIFCVLPWGNEAEHARSERLAAAMPNAVVPPKLELNDIGALLGKARVVIGVDTGLTHLAAALNVPTVGIYCATDTAATGICPAPHAVNLGGIGTPPAVDDAIDALQRLKACA